MGVPGSRTLTEEHVERLAFKFRLQDPGGKTEPGWTLIPNPFPLQRTIIAARGRGFHFRTISDSALAALDGAC